MTQKISPFEFVKSINYTKVDLIKNSLGSPKDYNPFLTNRALSYFLDTIFFAQEMNISHNIPPQYQYGFLLNIIDKRQRFSKWHKGEEVSEIECVKSIYNVNSQKASDIISLLSKEQLEKLKQMWEIENHDTHQRLNE